MCTPRIRVPEFRNRVQIEVCQRVGFAQPGGLPRYVGRYRRCWGFPAANPDHPRPPRGTRAATRTRTIPRSSLVARPGNGHSPGSLAAPGASYATLKGYRQSAVITPQQREKIKR